MELVIADAPAGNLICRVLRTKRQEFPQSIDTFFVDLIPLLEAAWMGKELMKDSVNALKMRKRKSLAIVAIEDTSPSFPHSFYKHFTTPPSSSNSELASVYDSGSS